MGDPFSNLHPLHLPASDPHPKERSREASGAKLVRLESEEPRYLSISELVAALVSTLEREFPIIYFEGEVTEVKRAQSGHIYFSIKDPTAETPVQIPCVVWRGSVARLGCQVATDMHVLCEGKITFYRVQGKFQIDVRRMIPAGAGLLQKRFNELKAKLETEGVFDPSRKRPLPRLPRSIGIVTSAAGAVIHDIMVRIRERMPGLRVYLVDSRVQGEGAAKEIADGIRLLNDHGVVDVIIVARGGGSLEDLWSFNEEEVVRAIFKSRIPVVSGVGHEPDVTLSDLVADVRAPTPTAAAEIVVPHQNDLLLAISHLERRLGDESVLLTRFEQQLDDCENRIGDRAGRLLESLLNRLVSLAHRVAAARPDRVLRNRQLSIDVLLGKLHGVVLRSIDRNTRKLGAVEALMARLAPEARVTRAAERLGAVESLLSRVVAQNIRERSERLVNQQQHLEALSPQRVLERGYTMVRKRGSVISSVKEIAAGEDIEICWRDGNREAVVK